MILLAHRLKMRNHPRGAASIVARVAANQEPDMKFILVLLLVISIGRFMWIHAGAQPDRPPSADSAEQTIPSERRTANSSVIQAVTEGSVEDVERYLCAGGATVTEDAGVPLLGLAAWHGREEIMRMLMAHGADVNAASPTGWTALMLAALGGHMESIDMLLEAGADVNARTAAGTTAISVALDRGHFDVAERLELARRRSRNPSGDRRLMALR